MSALERSRAPGISEAARREERKWTTCNPMRRRLVSHPRDWPWSSWSHYEKGGDGSIRIDTLGEEDKPGSLRNGKVKNRIYEAGAGVKTWFCADGWHTARKEVAARVLA